MAFFDEVSKKISQTSQSVTQKTKDMAETVRLNSQISDEEKKTDGFLLQLGKVYFAKHSVDPEPEFAELIAGIEESRERVNTYSEQVKQLKGIIKCPKCNGDVQYNSQFCPSCGLDINASKAVPAKSGRTCPNCNATISADLSFCIHCGTKLD